MRSFRQWCYRQKAAARGDVKAAAWLACAPMDKATIMRCLERLHANRKAVSSHTLIMADDAAAAYLLSKPQRGRGGDGPLDVLGWA